jgi:hypothetical protein
MIDSIQVATVKVEWNVVSFMRWIKGSDCVLQVLASLVIPCRTRGLDLSFVEQKGKTRA